MPNSITRKLDITSEFNEVFSPPKSEPRKMRQPIFFRVARILRDEKKFGKPKCNEVSVKFLLNTPTTKGRRVQRGRPNVVREKLRKICQRSEATIRLRCQGQDFFYYRWAIFHISLKNFLYASALGLE